MSAERSGVFTESGKKQWIENREPKVDRMSDRRCCASRTCGLRGAREYSDDISTPGQAIAAFVRAPHAHAMVERINAAAARRTPGVIAVLTGGDYVADGPWRASHRAPVNHSK